MSTRWELQGPGRRAFQMRAVVTIAFWHSTGVFDPCRPSSVDERIASITRLLLVTISIAMTHGLGHAQPPSARQETMLLSSTTAQDGSSDNQSTSIQQGPLEQVATSPRRLRVPDTFPQSPANAAEATTTIGSLGYTPLSASSTCLSSERIRPTPSHQQVFRRLGPRPRASGPTMAEVRRVGRSDLARLWRTQNREDSSRLMLYRRSCMRMLATFRRANERSLPGCGIPQPEW